MGSVEAPTEAILHFGVPDFSVPAEERGFFAFPAYESVSKVTIPLHDARTDSDITGGPEGLDAQGFTYLNHRSVLADNDRWFEGDNIEKFYLQECEDLIRTITGARRSVAINCSFRRRPVNTQSDPKAFVRRGCEIDENLAKLPRDKCTGTSSSFAPCSALSLTVWHCSIGEDTRQCKRARTHHTCRLFSTRSQRHCSILPQRHRSRRPILLGR